MATKMTYTRLGNTGMKVSRLCLGTMTYGSKKWREWVLAHPAVTAPIIGASKLSHLDDALGALEITLSAEDKASMEEPYTPHPVLGF